MKKAIAMLLVAFLAVGGIFAGGKKDSGKVSVVLIMKSLANEHFSKMAAGGNAYANSQGIALTTTGMNSETDIDTMTGAIDNAISRGVDVIIVTPADSVAIVPFVKRAVDAGIQVVNLDVTLDKDALVAAGLPRDFLYVGPDNAGAAEMAGDALGAKLGRGGKVFIIEGIPGADNATQRKSGFMKSVEKYGLEVLASNTAHWETEEANTLVSNLLTRYPEVQGIMCANDSMALGAIRALEAAGRSDVLVIGFDGITAVQDLIKEGKMFATVDQNPGLQAEEAIKAGIRMHNGEKLSGWIQTPASVVTTESFKK